MINYLLYIQIMFGIAVFKAVGNIICGLMGAKKPEETGTYGPINIAAGIIGLCIAGACVIMQ